MSESDPATPTMFTSDEEQRNKQFIRQKEDGEQMVHRLRNWEDGDILWGYASIKPGSVTGKTFSRRKSRESKERAEAEDFEYLNPADAHEDARHAYESCVDPDRGALGGHPGSAVFLYVARIGSVRTEPHSKQDPEPPLKFAELESVKVLKSTYIPDDA